MFVSLLQEKVMNMNHILLYILLFFTISLGACSKSGQNEATETSTADSSASPSDLANSADSLPSGKGTESSSSAQPGLGTSENGLSTDVVKDTLLNTNSSK
jgi:hypothetical protein